MLLHNCMGWRTWVTHQQEELSQMLATNWGSLAHNMLPSTKPLEPGLSFLFVFTQHCWLPWDPEVMAEFLCRAGTVNQLETRSSFTLVKYLRTPNRSKSWSAGLNIPACADFLSLLEVFQENTLLCIWFIICKIKMPSFPYLGHRHSEHGFC